MSVEKEKIWTEYLATAEASLVDNDSASAKKSKADLKEKFKNDAYTQVTFKQFIASLFSKHDKEKNGHLKKE